MSLHWSDGNLAALAAYERQQDAYAARDELIDARAEQLGRDRDERIDAFALALDRSELITEAYEALYGTDGVGVLLARKRLAAGIDAELRARAERQIDEEAEL